MRVLRPQELPREGRFGNPGAGGAASESPAHVAQEHSLHVPTAMLFRNDHLHGACGVCSRCAAVCVASCSRHSFLLSESQFLVLEISLPRNVSVSMRKDPAGFGQVGMAPFLASEEESP